MKRSEKELVDVMTGRDVNDWNVKEKGEKEPKNVSS